MKLFNLQRTVKIDIFVFGAEGTAAYKTGPVSYTHLDVYKRQTDGYPVEHRCLIGSPLHLRRLLMNIISNAVKYNRVGGEIRLECLSLIHI